MKVRAGTLLAALTPAVVTKRSACALLLALLAALCTFGCAPRLTYGDYVGTWTASLPVTSPEVTEVVVGEDGDGSVTIVYGGREVRCGVDWKKRSRSLVGTRPRDDGNPLGKELATVTLADGKLSGIVKDPGPVVVDPRPGEAAPGQVVVTFYTGKWEGRFAGFTRRPSAKP